MGQGLEARVLVLYSSTQAVSGQLDGESRGSQPDSKKYRALWWGGVGGEGGCPLIGKW